MKHIILAVAFDSSTWDVCRPFVERSLSQVRDFHAQVDTGLWVFRTQECYSVVHELEHFFAGRGIRFMSIALNGPLPCSVSKDAGEALRMLGVEVCNISSTRFQPVAPTGDASPHRNGRTTSMDFNSTNGLAPEISENAEALASAL